MRPITERSRKQHLATVQLNHPLHDILDLRGLGDVLLFNNLRVGKFADGVGRFSVRLIPAEIVPRGDIDEAHVHGFLRQRGARQQACGGGRGDNVGRGLQGLTA